MSFLELHISFLVAACSFAVESLCVRIVLFLFGCHAFDADLEVFLVRFDDVRKIVFVFYICV